MTFVEYAEAFGLDPSEAASALTERTRRGRLSGADRRELDDTPLEARWYASLDDRPDYEVYDADEYAIELWFGWIEYSRGYVRDLGRLVDRGILVNVESVADLGCGAALTTVALCDVWPLARVIGTNVSERQLNVGRRLAAQAGFEIETALMERVDLVFASEYFEHFREPVAHLDDVLDDGRPRYVVTASSFTARAIGHFPSYCVDGREIAGRETARLFNRRLRDRGYEPVLTGFWNNKPAVWRAAER